jgi:hypothetical protein
MNFGTLSIQMKNVSIMRTPLRRKPNLDIHSAEPEQILSLSFFLVLPPPVPCPFFHEYGTGG